MTPILGRCEICGATQVPIRPALVEWVAPLQPTWEHVDRCVDVDACKERVASLGDEWPVREGKAR